MEAIDAPALTSAVTARTAAIPGPSVATLVEAAFDEYAGRIKAFALAGVRDQDAADDLVQETFLRFVRQVKDHGEPGNTGGWLFRVCANLVISRGRRRSVADRMRGLLIDRSIAASPEEHVIRTDENARLGEALAEMPADARVALLMAAQGFSAAEIGTTIGRTPGATATYICRARIRLHERLATEEAGPR